MIHNVYIELKKGRVSSYESRLNCCDEVMIYCISILVNISQCSNSQKCMPIGRTTNTFIFLLPYLLNNLVCLSSRHCSGSGDSVVTSWRHSSLKNRCHSSRSSRVRIETCMQAEGKGDKSIKINLSLGNASKK